MNRSSTSTATNKNPLEPPRSPDPTVFIHAGTSGVRHLFPIHLADADDHFTRSISRLRSHTPSTELCKHLDLSDNNLENLPIDLSLLVHLQSLNCSHNHLTHLSDVFEQLEQLTELDLSFNHFKRLPHVIWTFKHLIRFNCEHNSLKTLDSNMCNLIHLKFLVLDHNQFQSFHQLDFSQLKNLEYLHIAHNQLMKFPMNLHKLRHLKNVNLSHNHLTSFPTELFLINTLDVLNVSHNYITRLLPLSDIYKRTTLMFSVDLSFNQLTKFYDYLLLISLKLDLSNNKIQSIPHEFIRKLTDEMITHRELKLTHNPLIQPVLPADLLNNPSPNILQVICHSFQEQQTDEIVRQGFQISITGAQKSGKSSLAYCLEEHMPLISEEKSERIVNIFQFPFRFGSTNDQATVEKKPKGKHSNVQIDQRKGKKPSSAPPRQHLPTSSSSASVLNSPLLPSESIKSLPLTIFDFNGAEEYYEHLSPFLDTDALHLICVHAAEFQQASPANIDEVFHETFDCSSYPMIRQLMKILQLLCEKVTEKNSLMIIPVATCMDLFDKQSTLDKIQALDKINQFFKLYLQSRIHRIESAMKQIDSLPIISSSLSNRLKTYNSLLNRRIQIASCQPISTLSYQGLDELNRTIEHCIITQKSIFPHIDRILPSLWAETNRYIESLPMPYLLWDDFIEHIVNRHGLRNLIPDITLSLEEQGKILVLNEIAGTNRLVVLRPLWLGDLLSALFHPHCEHQSGHLHSDQIRSLWNDLLGKKEYFAHVCWMLMRFLLIAYPKIGKKQLKVVLNGKEKSETRFDYVIVPYYLPLIDLTERKEEMDCFYAHMTDHVSVCYRSTMLPLGFFHRYTVSVILKLDVSYIKHWNDFLRGEDESKRVQFLLQTDHQLSVKIICGTNISEQPFDHIWTMLMLMLNHLEEMFRVLAPNNQFERSIQCPFCNEYSFMGEWITPKELQGLKFKNCSSCGANVDTNYLVQPNEKKRRNEELLKQIRERKANNQVMS